MWIGTLIEASLDAAIGLLAVPVSVLLVEVAQALRAPPSPSTEIHPRGSVAILVPAHDEACGIGRALRSVIPQLQSHDRLLVVADNCTDDTAAIARHEGAEVVVREDPGLRGKGYALDFGVRHLAADPPALVIIVDADCRVQPDCIERLAQACVSSMRPVQALYLMQAGADAPLKARLAQFAWILKNWVRPRGLLRMNLPCQLMGTGMAFPWPLIAAAPLASGHIVEDLKLGIDLACAGAAPLFCPSACVVSEFPASGEGIRAQRTRWEHGHLGMIAGEAPRLLSMAVRKRSAPLLAMALDLGVPPIAALTLAIAATWTLSAIFATITFVISPLLWSSALALALALPIALARHRFAGDLIGWRDLPLGIVAACGKIPLYWRFLFARQSAWIRSSRERK